MITTLQRKFYVLLEENDLFLGKLRIEIEEQKPETNKIRYSF